MSHIVKPAARNPRVDAVVQLRPGRIRRLLRRPGRVKVLTGTPMPGTLLENRLGAPAVPPDALHLGDVYVPQDRAHEPAPAGRQL